MVAAREGQTPSDRAIEARLGEPVSLYAVVVVGRGAQTRYYTAAPALQLGARRVPARQLRPFAALGAAVVTWSLVEPYPHHVARTPPNEGNPAYSNSVLFGPRHGTWLGFDTLEYHESVVEGGGAPTLVVARATPTDAHVNVHGGLGTMRYRIVVRAPATAVLPAGATLESPGAGAIGPRGILPSVMRVSFRAAEGDDLVAYLAGFFNVPNLFGSAGVGAGHQTELHQGADCADVIVGAARKMGVNLPYTSVTGLFAQTDPVTPLLYLTAEGVLSAAPDAGGKPVRLRFGTDVRRGDLMLIDYRGVEAGARAWDHIAVVARDAGELDVFDPQDLVQHMGYLYGLAEEPAASQAPAVVQFLRWKPHVARALARAAGRPASTTSNP